MGCFSFRCKKCGKGIQSNSFRGQECRLFLLQDGKVTQKMKGEYDSYGRVFINDTQSESVEYFLRKSLNWNDPTPGIPDEYGDGDFWGRICVLMFGNSSNGIAAYHEKCYNGEIPTTDSESDPNQGWGEEDEEDSFGCVDPDRDYNEDIELLDKAESLNDSFGDLLDRLEAVIDRKFKKK